MIPAHEYVSTRPTPHLGALGADGALVAVVDVHGAGVMVFQRRPHDHVVKAIHVDVRESRDGRAKPSIFDTLGAFQKPVPIQNTLARGKGRVKASLTAFAIKIHSK